MADKIYVSVINLIANLAGIDSPSDLIKDSKDNDSSFYVTWDREKLTPKRLELFFSDSQKINLGRKELNQILLLIGADPVSEPFFKMVFDEKITTLEDLEEKVENFRIKASRKFGNIKYAFRFFAGVSSYLAESSLGLDRSPEYIWNELNISEDVLKLKYRSREDRPLEVKEIDYDDRHYVSELNKITDKGDSRYKHSVQILNQAKFNSLVYLTSDYIDVYVATSMRTKKQFAEIGKKINSIFSTPKLKDLKVRYFDPTLSDCEDRLNKGLIEALMLKRAVVTLYLAQESDSLGKDSELATTLAQGKDVIVYVPSIDVDCRTKDLIEIFNLNDATAVEEKNYFKKIFFDAIINKTNYSDLAIKLITEGVIEDDSDFRRMAEYEMNFYDKRASLLKDKHPLGLQVNLQTGVANGVIVVRREAEAAELVYRSLTNSHRFKISDTPQEFKLIEEETESTVRYITKDKFLTKTFWANYLDLKRHE